MTRLTRRRLFAAAPLALAALPFAGSLRPQAARAVTPPRVLVLLELNGGNDALNTVVPYGDAAYFAARRGLAITRDRVLQLDDHLGLHPALAPLMGLWQARELSIALGVGYPRPNRSHFRSIEIWNTASEAEETLHDGWLHRVLMENAITRASAPLDFVPQGIVLGGAEGPLAGTALSPVVMRDPRQLDIARRLLGGAAAPANGGNPALRHILATRESLQATAQEIARRLRDRPPPSSDFPKTAFGRQLALAARIIAAGVPASVIKLQHSGYDTHARQAGQHAALLAELAGGLAAFRKSLVAAGAWRRTLLMTYAEFGRRVAENASGGSDHGTAAAHFLLGGRLRGGFRGVQPSLDELEGGDLRASLDFRRLYAAVAGEWLGLPASPDSLGRHAPLELVA